MRRTNKHGDCQTPGEQEYGQRTSFGEAKSNMTRTCGHDDDSGFVESVYLPWPRDGLSAATTGVEVGDGFCGGPLDTERSLLQTVTLDKEAFL